MGLRAAVRSFPPMNFSTLFYVRRAVMDWLRGSSGCAFVLVLVPTAIAHFPPPLLRPSLTTMLFLPSSLAPLQLCDHLWRVCQWSEINRMTADNLSIVFGPTLLWGRGGGMSLEALTETKWQTLVVKDCIANYQYIFRD